jgi:hypothetical protein
MNKVIFSLLSCLFYSVCISHIGADCPDSPKACELRELPLYSGESPDNQAWKDVAPYLMPKDHPLKARLDTFFSKKRAISNVESMIAAGFQSPFPRRATGVVVTKHPEFPHYVFKIYLDDQPYYKDLPEHHCWILRIRGVQKLSKVIQDNNLESRFKVPRKWIYALPENPKPAVKELPKHFILVEEDMDIYPDLENEKIWGSPVMTKELLTSLYKVLEEVGLYDSKPANLPFSRDGRIAFIDTQSWKEWPVKYEKITPFLSPEMQEFWITLGITTN